MENMIFPRPGRTALVVIDVQENLFKVIPDGAADRLVKAHHVLLEWADIYDIPVTYTEHYPNGLGPTIPALREPLSTHTKIKKTEFSACRNVDFQEEYIRQIKAGVRFLAFLPRA